MEVQADCQDTHGALVAPWLQESAELVTKGFAAVSAVQKCLTLRFAVNKMTEVPEEPRKTGPYSVDRMRFMIQYSQRACACIVSLFMNIICGSWFAVCSNCGYVFPHSCIL